MYPYRAAGRSLFCVQQELAPTMQHDEWTAAIRKLMRSSDTSAEDWDAQLADTEAAEKTSVGDWHTQQTLGLYADFLRTQKPN
jgi:hypothetical protein